MPGTVYSYNDVLSMCDAVVHRKIIEGKSAIMVNLAMEVIWNEYDWADSIAALPPFFLIPSVQDYPNVPYTVKPSDFLGFRQARLVQTSGSPPVKWPINIQKHLELTHNSNYPQAISYQKSFDGFRIFPKPASNMGAPRYMVEGTYKKTVPNVSVATLDSKLNFGDDFLETWLAGLMWAGFKLAGDERAGQKIENNGVIQYSGQLAEFKVSIMEKAAEFGLEDGDVSIAPQEPLVGSAFTTVGWPGTGGIGF